jgi:hypothetical protein
LPTLAPLIFLAANREMLPAFQDMLLIITSTNLLQRQPTNILTASLFSQFFDQLTSLSSTESATHRLLGGLIVMYASLLIVQLVPRNWVTVHPSHEFRCFVRAKRLICALDSICFLFILEGISQRDPTHFFPDLVREKDHILGVCRSKLPIDIIYTYRQYLLS